MPVISEWRKAVNAEPDEENRSTLICFPPHDANVCDCDDCTFAVQHYRRRLRMFGLLTEEEPVLQTLL